MTDVLAQINEKFWCPKCQTTPAPAMMVQSGPRWFHQICGEWLKPLAATQPSPKEGQDEPISVPPSVSPAPFEECLDAVLAEIRAVMLKKQADYGPGNINAFGEFGVLVRVTDKIERLKTLHKTGKEPQNEYINDSWIDLANYACIALMVRRGVWPK